MSMVPDTPGVVAPDADGVARTRLEFLLFEELKPPYPVRPAILASWQRSREMQVPADKLSLNYLKDPDVEGQLSRSAEPVLQLLGQQLAGQPVSIILTDETGLVLSRTSGDAQLDRHLDNVMLAPGFSYAEQYAGTNGIGTALEARTGMIVFGHEHYAENLENLACAGVPICDPVSGRLLGALDLTCWRKDAEMLLLTLAKSTADQIQHGLRADSSRREVELFRAYRRACHRFTGIVFALTADAVMLNDYARAVLEPADQQALFARGVELADARDPAHFGSPVVALPSGLSARLYPQHIRVGDEPAGVVVHVKLGEPEPRITPVSRTQEMQLPGLVGSAPLWVRACRGVESAFQAGDWLAVEGEPGVGKSALLQAVQLRCASATGRLVVLDGADAIGNPDWVLAARQAICHDADALIVRHVDALDAPTLRSVSSALQQARNDERERPLYAAVTMGVDARSAGIEALLRQFPATVVVPSLRLRLEDVPSLVRFLLARLTGGGKISCSPEAMHVMMRLPWPGNVQQVHDVLHEVVQHRRAGVIQPHDLPPSVRSVSRRVLSALEAMERDAIVESLRAAGGDKSAAARALGMSRATIYRRIHDYGIVTETLDREAHPIGSLARPGDRSIVS